MARTYKRDSRGRFAGGGGGRPKVTGGTLKARTSARRSRAKLAAKDPADQSIKGQLSRRSQKGAVTRTQKGLAAARKAGRVKLAGRGGVIRPGGKTKPDAPVVSRAPQLLPPAKGSGKAGQRLGRVAGPLSADGARKRGETTKNRSDVSGAVADIKALGLPIYKPRTARSPGQAGVQVRKGPNPGTVGIITHTREAFDKALAHVERQGGQILYQNRQGQAFTFRNSRKPRAKASVYPKQKTVQEIRTQWDSRIAPALARRRARIEKLPLGSADRGNGMQAHIAREIKAGRALIKALNRSK